MLFFLSFSIKAQVVIHKAKQILVCDTAMHMANAMAVENGKIIEVGEYKKIKKNYVKPKIINHGNNYIYPGLIDAHCHFLAYCQGLKECNLMGCKTPAEVVQRLKAFQKSTTHQWLIGRGWDQNLWPGKEYPDLKTLDTAFSNIPVMLKRVDGHAAWLNSAAIKILKIDTRDYVKGGEYIFKRGEFTGVVVDKILDKVYPKVPGLPSEEMIAAVKQGQQTCLAFGLTTLDEAGLSLKQVNYIDSLQKAGILKIKIYAMLEPSAENLNKAIEGPTDNGMLHKGGFKFYMDGALGSRGALLKHDYCDRMGHKGLLLQDMESFERNCLILFYSNWQVCVHAIGDSANAIALSSMNRIMAIPGDQRWRIEHAQIVDTADMHYFDGKTILPSIQPTHATSDAAWALKRICETRKSEAYAYRSLKEHAGMVAIGTDFPVEDVSPIKSFYSAVTRRDAEGQLDSGFIPSQALSRKDALLGMTYWAAYANKEEKNKGSLEKGKMADFIIMDQNWLLCKPEQIKKTNVLKTFINGEMVYIKQ